MPQFRLAIIITCYNYADFVGSAIASVLSQNRDDCELVIVDDGSTDGSWEVINTTAARAFRIDNSGQLAACIFGLEQTSAPFVLFLDADDTLLPGALQVILDHLDDGVAKLQFPLRRIDGKGESLGETGWSLGRFRCRDELITQVRRTGVYPTPPTSGNVFRRDVCELLRGVDYDRAVDGVILFAAPFLGDVVGLAEPQGCYRIHDRNDSGLGRPLDAASLQRDVKRFVDRHEHLRRVLRERGDRGNLVESANTYFHQERAFCICVAQNRRIGLTMLTGLVSCLWKGQMTARNKLVATFFYTVSAVLPNQRARRALAYRLNPTDRSLAGYLKVLLG